LENQINQKVKNYLGIANQAGYIIIGSDNLDGYDKKLYLILIDKTAGKNSQKIANRHKEKGIPVFEIENLSSLVNIESCKIVGLKNKGISETIINLL